MEVAAPTGEVAQRLTREICSDTPCGCHNPGRQTVFIETNMTPTRGAAICDGVNYE